MITNFNISGYLTIASGVTLDANAASFRLFEYAEVNRQPVTINSIDGINQNIVFNLPSGSTNPNTIGVYDAAVGGNLLFFIPFRPFVVDVNNNVTIPSSDVIFNGLQIYEGGISPNVVFGSANNSTNTVVNNAVVSGCSIFINPQNYLTAGLAPTTQSYSSGGSSNSVPQIQEADFTQTGLANNAVVDSWPASTNIAAKYIITTSQIVSGVIQRYQFDEVVVAQDSSNVELSTFASVYNGTGPLISFAANLSNNTIYLSIGSLNVSSVNVYFRRILFST